jgi:hypothetical protein
MTDTTVDVSNMTPAEATTALASMKAAYDVANGLPVSDPRARLNTLAAAEGWRTRLLAGDVATMREFRAANEAAAGVDQIGDALAGRVPDGLVVTMPGELAPAKMAATVNALREVGVRDAAIREALESRPITREVRDLALQRRDQRMSDPEWRKKALAGDLEARRELALLGILLGAPVEEAVR